MTAPEFPKPNDDQIVATMASAVADEYACVDPEEEADDPDCDTTAMGRIFQDQRIALEALRSAGYEVVPKTWIDAVRKIDEMMPDDFPDPRTVGLAPAFRKPDFEAAFRLVCRILNGALYNTDEEGNPI